MALAIGHLARPRGFVHEAPARAALQSLATDPAVQPAVLDALDDLEVALMAGRDESELRVQTSIGAGPGTGEGNGDSAVIVSPSSPVAVHAQVRIP